MESFTDVGAVQRPASPDGSSISALDVGAVQRAAAGEPPAGTPSNLLLLGVG